jgi:hypothetical protein
VRYSQANAAFILSKGTCPSSVTESMEANSISNVLNPTVAETEEEGDVEASASSHEAKVSSGAFLSQQQWDSLSSTLMRLHSTEKAAHLTHDGVDDTSMRNVSSDALLQIACGSRFVILSAQSHQPLVYFSFDIKPSKL